jgi:hypothetical protein
VARNEGGLLLDDAIRNYGDPQLWAAYQAAVERQQAIPPQPGWFGSSGRAWSNWKANYARLMGKTSDQIAAAAHALHKEFKERLRSGELIGTGIKLPVTTGSRPEPIAPALWDVLVLDFASNQARSRGLTYHGVRIGSAADGFAVEPNAFGDAKVGGAPVPASSPSYPGRPSVMKKVRLEMERRAGEGLLCDTLKAESDELATWIAHELPSEQTPTAKTIRNACRDMYRQLKARNTGPKLTDLE